VLGYVLESDSRTSFRLFCWTKCEISFESNVIFGSDYGESPVSIELNTKVKG